MMDPVKMKEVLEGVKSSLEDFLENRKILVGRVQKMISDSDLHKKEMAERKETRARQRKERLDQLKKAGYDIPTE